MKQAKKKFAYVTALASAAVVAGLAIAPASVPAQDITYSPEFNAQGDLLLPKDHQWREWVYAGAVVTPNALNGGEAPFPEFHSVWIEPGAYQHYKETGIFPEGTAIAKELGLVGSTEEVSGIGYFMGKLQGFEITIKSQALYPDEPGNWAYYSFGHHDEPYQVSAKRAPAEACNACHEAAAEDDFVFTQFYPFLKAAKPH